MTSHKDLVKLLISRKIACRVQSPLFWTPAPRMLNRNKKITKKLVFAAANNDSLRSDLSSLLFILCDRAWLAWKTEDIEMLRILLDRGADANTTGKNSCYEGRRCNASALHFTAEKRLLPALKMLLERGADAKSISPCKGTTLMAATSSFKRFSHYDKESLSQDFEDIVDVLLKYGADINTTTLNEYHHESVLEIALQAPINIRKPCIQFLLSRGATINLSTPLTGSILNMAVSSDDLDLLDLILKVGADVNVLGGAYTTVLHGAMYRGSEKFVQLLIDAAADPFAYDEHGWTVSDMAIVHKNLRCLEIVSKSVVETKGPPVSQAQTPTALLKAVPYSTYSLLGGRDSMILSL
ncbi:hypothetical protein MMC11_007342 [Xylographa trunciseda]|nr:hypothetical protein [Xylographa trunciseda]